MIGWYHRDESARFATKWPESSRVSTFAISELKFMTKYHSHTVANPIFCFLNLDQKMDFWYFCENSQVFIKSPIFWQKSEFCPSVYHSNIFARTICFARKRAHQVANRDMRNSNRKLINVHDGLASRKFVEKFHQLLLKWKLGDFFYKVVFSWCLQCSNDSQCTPKNRDLWIPLLSGLLAAAWRWR